MFNSSKYNSLLEQFYNELFSYVQQNPESYSLEASSLVNRINAEKEENEDETEFEGMYNV